jgi:hypothetical protein
VEVQVVCKVWASWRWYYFSIPVITLADRPTPNSEAEEQPFVGCPRLIIQHTRGLPLSSAVKMEAVCSSETLVSPYKSTWLYSSEDQHGHRHCHENFKSLFTARLTSFLSSRQRSCGSQALEWPRRTKTGLRTHGPLNRQLILNWTQKKRGRTRSNCLSVILGSAVQDKNDAVTGCLRYVSVLSLLRR